MNNNSETRTNISTHDNNDDEWFQPSFDHTHTAEHNATWSSDDDDDDAYDNDEHEFFDAKEDDVNIPKLNDLNLETNKTNSEGPPTLLHERLNNSTNVDYKKEEDKSPEDPYYIDEDLLIEKEKMLTDDEKQQRYIESKTCKEEGNALFGRGEFDQSLEKYSNALCLCPLNEAKDRAIIYSNRAACLMKLEKFEAAVQSCTKAIELDPTYIKPLLRRADSYKQIDKLEDALQDYQRIVQLDPSNQQARVACHILPDQIKERNEKLKDEMLGKLKDLGNMILKPFGLSTENFKMQQDPSTGSYSVNFNQNR